MGDLSKDFSSSEFRCKCGCGMRGVTDVLIHGLQKMRDGYGKPMKISSGLRCKDWNRHEGGKDDSAHLSGCAADIVVRNSKQRFMLLREAIYAGFTRIGVGKTFIHVDVDTAKPQLVVWMY